MNFFEHSIEDAFLILFESASEGIVVVNSQQTIVATNLAARSMFGYENKELEGKHLHTLIPQNYHDKHLSHVKGFIVRSEKRSMGNQQDIYGLRKNGTIFPIAAGLNPFDLHGHRYVMSLITDITVRKENERQIRELNDHLEEKIQERTVSLNVAIEQLRKEVTLRVEAENSAKEALQKEKELNELKTKFLSLVSHEFKTPICGILTSATLVAKYTTEEQQEKREIHLETIKSKVKYLNAIIDDFLSLERLDTGKVNYKTTSFSLSKVLDKVIYDANMFLKNGQTINHPHNTNDIVLQFDEKILELSLSNLINNAIKYSGEYATILVLVKELKDFLEIRIIDEGIGIPEHEQRFIFNRYFRAENVLLNPGTGIGLNIVQSHLTKLGGTIAFASKLGAGSTFTITIPTVKQGSK